MTKDTSTWGFFRDGGAPMLGRAAESAALDEALEAVEKRGEPRAVTLIGAAGIGKSRLIQEFVIRHRALGSSLVPRVYRGRARDGASTFGLFGQILRARFGLVDGMEPDAAKAMIRAQVSSVMGDRRVGDVLYFLGRFLGLDFDDSPLTRAVKDDPQENGQLRRAILNSFLEADSMQAPICLVFEDLQAAHEDSIALLRHLIEHLSGRILIICAARPELLTQHEEFARAGEGRHKVIELAPLRDADATAMMQALLSPCEGGPPAQLVESACAFAAGNPQLLEQMVRIYHDKGVLEEVSELSEQPVWRVDLEKMRTVELPLTIEEAVNARIAALEPRERALLEQAATMGSVFWSGALVALARMGREAPELWGEAADDDAIEITATLSELVDRDYILKLPDSSFGGADEYVFKHNREREAIAKATLPSVAKRHHRGVAEWIDHQKVAHESEEYLAMLGDHREKGGNVVLSGFAYIEAGGLARRRYATGKACEYFEKGLALLGDSNTGRRIDALHDYGDVLLLSGRVDDALASFREMLTLAYRLDLRAKGGAAHNRIGRLYRSLGQLDEAAKHLHTAMELFREADDERGVASTIDDIGKLHWMKGEYEQALVSLRDALARRRRLADRRSIALSLNNIGCVLQDSGKFAEALEAFDQALHIRREIEDLVGVAVTLNNLGTIAQDQQDFPRALSIFNEALAVAKQVGDTTRVALVLINLGELHYRMGNLDQAIDVLKQAESSYEELGDKLALAETHRGLGKAYLLQKDLLKAREHISRAVDLFAEVRSKVHLGGALRTLGEITAAGGWGSSHTRSAREYFARAVAIFEQTGNEVELARTCKAFARFLRTEKDLASDDQAQRDAEAMEARADAIFARLRIASPRASFPDLGEVKP